ncbi:MAG: hypothetical protein A4E61_00059 [Syntrophorhabdus sp. PtaB.Bin184]|nr:MAG: hypothetical protein A4E61_00059 [Syntrophorhabdus sp. PtaB.Bin184]
MKRCDVCLSDNVVEKVDFGLQPICNRFLTRSDAEESRFPFVFGQCQACGTMLNLHRVSAAELRPPFEWITYNEPEGHLDHLCEVICRLPGLHADSTFCGVSFKDDTLLERLKNRGFRNTWRIDPAQDLGVDAPGIGVETVQDRINSRTANIMTDKYGRADVVIARHILEHASDPEVFINSLLELARPGGYMVIEVPDCSGAIENHDYTTFWEEHFVYFTPQTFKTFFGVRRLVMRYYECFEYAFENSLVGIGQRGDIKDSFNMDQSAVKDEIDRTSRFLSDYPDVKRRTRGYFADHLSSKGKTALFGAGHLACTYINLFQLEDRISFVADDNPNKTGLFMPGSRLPIKPSSALVEEGIKLCCLSLSPEIEDKVIGKNSSFVRSGGVFASIFSRSTRALRI